MRPLRKIYRIKLFNMDYKNFGKNTFILIGKNTFINCSYFYKSLFSIYIKVFFIR